MSVFSSLRSGLLRFVQSQDRFIPNAVRDTFPDFRFTPVGIPQYSYIAVRDNHSATPPKISIV